MSSKIFHAFIEQENSISNIPTNVNTTTTGTLYLMCGTALVTIVGVVGNDNISKSQALICHHRLAGWRLSWVHLSASPLPTFSSVLWYMLRMTDEKRTSHTL